MQRALRSGGGDLALLTGLAGGVAWHATVPPPVGVHTIARPSRWRWPDLGCVTPLATAPMEECAMRADRCDDRGRYLVTLYRSIVAST